MSSQNVRAGERRSNSIGFNIMHIMLKYNERVNKNAPMGRGRGVGVAEGWEWKGGKST